MEKRTDKKIKKHLSNLFLDWQKSLGRIARREEAERLAMSKGKNGNGKKYKAGEPRPRSDGKMEKEIRN